MASRPARTPPTDRFSCRGEGSGTLQHFLSHDASSTEGGSSLHEPTHKGNRPGAPFPRVLRPQGARRNVREEQAPPFRPLEWLNWMVLLISALFSSLYFFSRK